MAQPAFAGGSPMPGTIKLRNRVPSVGTHHTAKRLKLCGKGK
jgi:hypothetical protein